ncbi:acyltransferase [Candidatus Saccharibacteria bacterium]|nr:acyltransferase [Candidatus Saccharibacteria bacterium]
MVLRLIAKVFSYFFGGLKLFLVKCFNIVSFKYHLSSRVPILSSISIIHGKLSLGKECNIGNNTVISAVGGKIVIGDGSFVNRNCQIIAHDSIIIGKNVMIGPNVVIMDHDHKIENGSIKKREYVTKGIKIEDGAWIGANSVILKGVTVGKNAIVAAGSIVTHDCQAGSVLIQKRKTEFVELKKK